MGSGFTTMSETVTISARTYKGLVHAAETLAALYAGGVDNWEGYDACFEDQEDEDEDLSE